MISYKTRRILLQLIPFGIIPLVFSITYSLLEKGILGDHPEYPATGNPYNFQLIIPALLSMIAGFVIGVAEIFYINKLFRNRSFLIKIVFKSAIHLSAIIVASMLIIILSNAYRLGVSPLSAEVWQMFGAFLNNFAFWSLMLYFTIAVVSSLFYLEVSDNIGQTVLLNFFTGKYHQPIEEERVYMFLDMKSSTTIAEQLGHKRYFQMLKEYYVALSDPIVTYGGLVYQYVGDEVVVTWKFSDGMPKNVLKCFFAMKESLQIQASNFKSQFGVVPTFKAGIHFGKVTTGEIGVIKKEIIFSGDVLNTTARIQGLCNTYGVDLLTSEKFITVLKSNNEFQTKSMGEADLRGKNEKINIYTITKK